MNRKAIIAMSGGVDSSVAAFLMKEQGFDCIGVMMKLFENPEEGADGQRTCCSLSDAEDARSVAFKLGMPFYVFNFKEAFKEQVIQRFITAYENGMTPNPCIDCNRSMKFEKLYARAKELGRDVVVTGHYARIEYHEASGRYLLKKAADASKDQSYVLYAMTQDQLAHTRFPLGERGKAETRRIAEANGFVNAAKRDSQNICFVPDGDYAKFIEASTGKSYEKGYFTDFRGNILGEHQGMIRYTIGQRKGLGLALPKPLYVGSKCPASNRVILCEESGLYSNVLEAEDFNWIAFNALDKPMRLKAKVRYRQAEQWATVTPISVDRVRIEFDAPQRAIAKGQAVVLYDGDVVAGGGTIVETEGEGTEEFLAKHQKTAVKTAASFSGK